MRNKKVPKRKQASQSAVSRETLNTFGELSSEMHKTDSHQADALVSVADAENAAYSYVKHQNKSFSVKRAKSSTLLVHSNLEIGTINLKLCIPGLFDILIPLPRVSNISAGKWILKFYDEFHGKYWIKSPNSKYACLICGRQYRIRDGLVTHLNHHMGLKIARCLICSRSFYSMNGAVRHVKLCMKIDNK